MAKDNPDKQSCFEQPHWQVYGTATLGERGQLVIPAEARKEFNIGAGDRFVVLGVTEFGTIGLVKADVFSKMADSLLSQASALARYTDINKIQPHEESDDATA